MTTLEKFGNVKVSCSNEELGCPWKGLLKDLEEHSGPCEKQFFRSAIIDIHMLKGRLDQKDREIHFIKNDFAIKIQKIAKQSVIKKKEKLVKIRDQTEKLGEILFAKVGEVQEENIKKNEEIDILKKEVEELKTAKSELRSELNELKKENQKLGKEISEVSLNLKRYEKLEEYSIITTVTGPTELVKEVLQNPSLPPKTRKVFFDMAAEGTIMDKKFGRIIIDLFDERAPNTCEKFAQLCALEKGTGYKGSKFYKIYDDYCDMVATSTLTYPTGGNNTLPVEYKTPLENLSDKHDEKGIVTMINSWESGKTQEHFFITRKPVTRFDGKYVIIGKVTKDTWCTMEDIIKQPTSDNRPKKTIYITDCGVLD